MEEGHPATFYQAPVGELMVASRPRRGRSSWLRAALCTAAVALAGLAAGCGSVGDKLFCDGPEGAACEFTSAEWRRVASLANLGEPPSDLSNRFTRLDHPQREAAITLGWKLYFDKHLSGPAYWEDSLGRPLATGRPERAGGAPLCPGSDKDSPMFSTCKKMEVSCQTCHDPARAGSDFSSLPGHVSVGSGWYDVNGQQVLNAAHYKLLYWNGRSDSLWSQAAAVIESDISVNGNRMEVVRRVSTAYAAEYTAVFGEAPPVFVPEATIATLVDRVEQGAILCKIDPATLTCPEGCRPHGEGLCRLRYPPRGKPGRYRGCQPTPVPAVAPGAESAPDWKEPHGDVFDCMAEDDKAAINKAYANITKAIGAYESVLASTASPFDRYVNGERELLSKAAVRGVKLFVGRASCIDCHKGALLSDAAINEGGGNNLTLGFHNIGVPQRGEGIPTERDCRGGKCDCTGAVPPATTPPVIGATWPSASCLPWGLYNGLARLHGGSLRRSAASSDDRSVEALAPFAKIYEIADLDTPAPEVTKGLWRTPSLRDVALTAPYMHNGVYATLDEVLWHYDQGGTPEASGKKSVELKPLFLTAQDRADLIEFLSTLTGIPAANRAAIHLPPPPTP